MKIGITGHSGFIGYHLKNRLIYQFPDINVILIDNYYFNSAEIFKKTLIDLDILVHLAGVNRHEKENFVYDENIRLANVIASATDQADFRGKIIFASSTQINKNTLYGKAKLKCSEILFNSSKKIGFKFISIIIPNVFGPFCKPNYNSFISTFSYNIINNIPLEINPNSNVSLIYIDNLIIKILHEIFNESKNNSKKIKPDIQVSPQYVYNKLLKFKIKYLENHIIPNFQSKFEKFLFYTFISFIDLKTHFPISNIKKTDNRGFFCEIIKINGDSQFSYSITKKGITRGDHFHTRKIERFTIIEGKALIKIRKIGTEKPISFEIINTPMSIDMLPWYTHNIQNIGEKNLITLFTINEHFNENDSDTYYEKV